MKKTDLVILFAASSLVVQGLPTGNLAVRTLVGDGISIPKDGTGTGARVAGPRDILYDSDTGYYYFTSDYAIRRMNPNIQTLFSSKQLLEEVFQVLVIMLRELLHCSVVLMEWPCILLVAICLW